MLGEFVVIRFLIFYRYYSVVYGFFVNMFLGLYFIILYRGWINVI